MRSSRKFKIPLHPNEVGMRLREFADKHIGVYGPALEDKSMPLSDQMAVLFADTLRPTDENNPLRGIHPELLDIPKTLDEPCTLYWPTHPGFGMAMRVVPMGSQTLIKVDMPGEPANDALLESLTALLESLSSSSKEAKKASSTTGVTDKVQRRFDVFNRLKDENPEWTQAKVALEAQEELGEPNINAETVRNAYRAMGEKWESADKLR